MHPSPFKAIIVGAGVAGLAAATRLAVQGFSVTVFEKNSYPGGKLSHFERGGYHFDAGPSLFTQPANIEELFAFAGEPVEGYFQYRSLPVACTYFYEDGTIIHAYTHANQFAEELQLKTGEKASTLLKYLDRSAKAYKNIATVFLNYSLHKASTLYKAPVRKAIAALRPAYLLKTLNGINEQAFTKLHTIQLFNRYATYNGSNPYQAPGMLSLIPHLEQNEGTFYPEGGMISITNALYQLAVKKGVEFHFNSPVEQITRQQHKVTGVTAAGKPYEADLVVSNMDVYFTYKHLLGNEQKATRLLKQERSSSALIFYWGIKQEFPQLQLHNIFFSKDYKAEFNHLFVQKTLYNDPTVYINITSKCEPGIQAPQGKENWFVMINAPCNIGQDWQLLKQQARQYIIQKLNRLLQTDIAPLIDVEEVLDPVSIEATTASYQGSLYGTSSNSAMAAFLRHPNFTRKLQRLYFAGGSVHPGGGIPLCLKSAKIMADLVQTDQKKWKPAHV